MSSGPHYFANAPVSGTEYWAPMGYGCIPNNGTQVSVTVKAWTGSNGTGSLIQVSTLTADVWDQTSNASKGSFGGNYNAVTATYDGWNGSDWCKPAGKWSGGQSVGSLEIWLSSYTGAAFVPSVSSFTPAQGPAGTSVTLTGSHFTDATTVTFNGSPASFTVVSDTSITATVPSGATYGPITVGNQNGSGTSSASFEPGAIWFGTGAGAVAAPIAIWYGTGTAVVKIVGVWTSNGAGGVKRIW